MFGISGEHLLVLLVILLIFGPKRLPDLGNSLGRTLRNFKDAMSNNNVEEKATSTQASPAQAPQLLAKAEPVPQKEEEIFSQEQQTQKVENADLSKPC